MRITIDQSGCRLKSRVAALARSSTPLPFAILLAARAVRSNMADPISQISVATRDRTSRDGRNSSKCYEADHGFAKWSED
ncbi:hypothetical protein FHS95_000496 [Sphingomonas naasensis]|uniref:Uncharacterized protein n=1 Tax=Sphingomonas naasensis TaxID=1344951 RepID=A0A4S1WRP8_9SPHN|nr:hypothetical protein [Sphingomonas naasensis]NIJ18827.1 hypothetical protein [Sphingomonas naasensis]TGX46054.1 hypothetical protein E5A74_02460 [Sphingomonas naasensis]